MPDPIILDSLPLIPTPPLIMAVNIGEAVCCPLPSEPPCVRLLCTQLYGGCRHLGLVLISLAELEQRSPPEGVHIGATTGREVEHVAGCLQ